MESVFAHCEGARRFTAIQALRFQQRRFRNRGAWWWWWSLATLFPLPDVRYAWQTNFPLLAERYGEMTEDDRQRLFQLRERQQNVVRVGRVLFHRPRLAHRRLCSRELLHGGSTRCSRTCCKTMTMQLLLNWSFTPMRRETRMVTHSTQLCPRETRMGGDFSEAVHAGSRTLRAHQRVHSECWKELVRAVQIGNSENRAVLLDKSVAIAPHLAEVVDHIVPLPPRLHVSLFGFRVASVSGAVLDQSRHSTVAPLLNRRVEVRCAPIMHDKGLHLPASEPSAVPSCLQAGCCVHDGDGLELWYLRNSLLQEMKEHFFQKSLARKWLAEHEVVARFSGSRVGIRNPRARRDALASGSGSAAIE